MARAAAHSLAHWGPPTTSHSHTWVRWQPYYATLSSVSSHQSPSYLVTPASSVSSITPSPLSASVYEQERQRNPQFHPQEYQLRDSQKLKYVTGLVTDVGVPPGSNTVVNFHTFNPEMEDIYNGAQLPSKRGYIKRSKWAMLSEGFQEYVPSPAEEPAPTNDQPPPPSVPSLNFTQSPSVSPQPDSEYLAPRPALIGSHGAYLAPQPLSNLLITQSSTEPTSPASSLADTESAPGVDLQALLQLLETPRIGDPDVAANSHLQCQDSEDLQYNKILDEFIEWM
ncbi:hypothetical protein BDR06DRAFT_1024789 [Suillus hirtellus]|nr:hypothetical protein BDR06DRAFT_1024789 [Suillus hirtellus]